MLMLRRGFIFITILFLACALYVLIFTGKTDSIGAPGNTLVISEIKIRNDPSSLNEFIELFNNSEEPLQLNQFQLTYYNISNPADTQLPNSSQILPDKPLEPFQTFILARDKTQITDSSQLSLSTGLSDSQGMVRLSGPDAENQNQSKIYDEIAWSGTVPLPEGAYKAQTDSTKNLSLQRYTRQTPLPVIFENDWLPETPTLYSVLYIPMDISEAETADGTPASEITCEGVIINELLPNPAGSDGGNEFIELYNPTDEVIPLSGCSLQTTANKKTHDFTDTEMQPRQYFTFYSSQTGLTLSNSAGGTVWLLSPTEELEAITYPGDLADDAGWARFAGGWNLTYQLTPNAANILVETEPCPAEQLRNPETNRCRSVLSVSTYNLIPCRPGQERNPATNRCRLISDSNRQLVPCNPGQVRNPETNRCRKVAASSLKPCAPGQFRNPATNRCKKMSGGKAAGLTTVKDVETSTGNTPIHWGVAGFISIGAIGYGVYEWRQDIFNAINRLRRKN